jgi:hypothetical protein
MENGVIEMGPLNVRFWLFADSLGLCLERPLYPRKPTLILRCLLFA